MNFKRKTELRFAQMELKFVQIEKCLIDILKTMTNLSRQDLDTLTLIANTYESKNKTTKKSR
jgi:hypothetical protein